MIKIEKITGTAHITREGKRMRVFTGQLVTQADIETLEVDDTVMYSVDELELVTVRAASSAESPAVAAIEPVATVPVAKVTKPRVRRAAKDKPE